MAPVKRSHFFYHGEVNTYASSILFILVVQKTAINKIIGSSIKTKEDHEVVKSTKYLLLSLVSWHRTPLEKIPTKLSSSFSWESDQYRGVE